ncbi:MAG: hypothetical protein JXR56_06320, partial [Candidatus Cloacimonetes bacterium]|nr:hypothetical protein [Candidatus Cloacimonadota bacterium]
EDLEAIRLDYLKHHDLERVHARLHQNFLTLLESLNLPEEIEKRILDKRWGAAGQLNGTILTATKIPKSGYIKEYFEAETSEEKRKIYCHCPRIRESIGEDDRLYSLYCYCGAGFYKGIWEYILGRSVKVRVKESILDGDDHCSFEIDLK